MIGGLRCKFCGVGDGEMVGKCGFAAGFGAVDFEASKLMQSLRGYFLGWFELSCEA